MSWKNADYHGFSLRGRMVLSTFFTSGLISILAAVAVSFFSYRHLIGDVNERLCRITDDLRKEYQEFGGLTTEFIHCVNEDVEEHDANVSFVLVANSSDDVVYATSMPEGYREKLVRMLQLKRYVGRFYTERSGTDKGPHGAVRFVTFETQDGGHITLASDVTTLERFMIAQAIVLGVTALLSTLLSCLSSYFVGGRILKLNRVMEEKDRAYAELRHLTDDIAHDLRTPLTRLSMAAETELTGGIMSEPLARQVMNESGDMLELINTMLEISQTEARIDRTPRESLDLCAFVRHAGELYAAVAEDTGIAFVVKMPSTPIAFSGHKGKLQQLIANLVENALKFTPKGGRIVIELKEKGANAELSVTDTGCGIAASDIPFVFKRFWRADASRHLPGNGLGLALVKAIVTSYGGTVCCTSKPNEGSVFTVILPIS